jgi:hypothetical protein
MGRERFAEFWQSSLPVDSAFHRAFGVSIEQWTMQWARDQVGDWEVGPGPTVGVTLSALMVAGVLVTASALLVAWRQVG